MSYYDDEECWPPCCGGAGCPACGDGTEYDGPAFADPGGRSALRAATEDNPRDQPCPKCGAPNRLTPADVALGYQCDRCADSEEGYGP